MSTRTYTVKELLADETTLRQAAEEVLSKGPWKHHGIPTEDTITHHRFLECTKCGARYYAGSDDGFVGCGAIPLPNCSVPDAAKGSLADIAEALMRKVMALNGGWFFVLCKAITSLSHETVTECQFIWWLNATPDVKSICCLIALGKAKVEP